MKSSFPILLFSIFFLAVIPEAEALRTDCSAQMVVLDENNNFVESSVSYEIRFYENENPTGGEIELAPAVTGTGTPTDGLLDLTFDCQIDLLAASDTVYMEMDLNGETLSPRTEMNSVPFAAIASSLLDDSGQVISFTGGDVTLSGGNLNIAADSIALGTDTTGNYVANLTAGSGISITGSNGEGSTLIISTSGAVGTSEITDGSIAAVDIANDSLDFDKFADSMSLDSNLVIAQGANTWTQTFTGTNSTAFSLSSSAVTPTSPLAYFSSNIGSSGNTFVTEGSLLHLNALQNTASSQRASVIKIRSDNNQNAIEDYTHIGIDNYMTDASVTGPGINTLMGSNTNLEISDGPKIAYGHNVNISGMLSRGGLDPYSYNYGYAAEIEVLGDPDDSLVSNNYGGYFQVTSNTDGTNAAIGIRSRGEAATTNIGGQFSATGPSGTNSYGVHASVTVPAGATGYAIYGDTDGTVGTAYAGYFRGDVGIEGNLIYTPNTVTVAAGDSINFLRSAMFIRSLTGAISLGNPTIVDGTNGQIIYIVNIGASAITFVDDPALGNINLAGDRTLDTGDSLTLIFSSGLGYWTELSFNNV